MISTLKPSTKKEVNHGKVKGDLNIPIHSFIRFVSSGNTSTLNVKQQSVQNFQLMTPGISAKINYNLLEYRQGSIKRKSGIKVSEAQGVHRTSH